MAFLAARLGTIRSMGSPRRLRPLLQHVPDSHRSDLVLLPGLAMAIVIMLIHTYYGLPLPVDRRELVRRSGRAVRTLVGVDDLRAPTGFAGRLRAIRQLPSGGS